MKKRLNFKFPCHEKIKVRNLLNILITLTVILVYFTISDIKYYMLYNAYILSILYYYFIKDRLIIQLDNSNPNRIYTVTTNITTDYVDIDNNRYLVLSVQDDGGRGHHLKCYLKRN